MKRLLLLVLLAGLALTACSGEEATEASHAEAQAISIKGLDELHYDPVMIEVDAGRPVALTLINDGALDHDFSILDMPLTGEVQVHTEDERADEGHEHEGEGHTHEEEEHAEHDHEMTVDADELSVHISATAGDRQTVTFTPAEPGEYEFFCSVPGHREGGMVGTLIVTES